MVYCDTCATKLGVPKSAVKVIERCECCGTPASRCQGRVSGDRIFFARGALTDAKYERYALQRSAAKRNRR